MRFTDILYTKEYGRAIVTINRPERLNALRGLTVDELIAALRDAAADRDVGVIVLTGAGDRAFCVGGDQKERTAAGYDASRGGVGLDVDTLHTLLRTIPKPVIAAVNGYAIGGGNIVQVCCDLAIAAEHALFGQAGPRVGSVDAGLGTAYLARLVGERKAREIWYLCRRYTAQQALAMGLVNHVVPFAELMPETMRWCDEILAMSPTALKLAKQSFNVDTEMIVSLGRFNLSTMELFYTTPEAEEGRLAFLEKRAPDFSRFRR